MALDWKTATLAPVPGEESIHLRYFDTGVPEGVSEPYTTIIAIHGFSSNAGAWANSASIFAKTGFRFIAHNRRGYEGSSEYYEGPVKDAVGRYMLDLAGFVRFAVDELDIPSKDARGRGGIVLMGWSKGTASVMTLLSLLASPQDPPISLPKGLDLSPYLSVLYTHLRHLILFEPPGETIGLPYTPDYAAVIHSSKPFLQAFPEWLIPTVPEEKRHLLGKSTDVKNALKDFPVWLAERTDEKECARVAEVGLRHVPKEFGVGLVWCETSIQWCRDTGAWIAERLGDQPNTLVKTILGGHHFYNMTDSEEFVETIAGLIKELDTRVYG
ncbi:alpha/beta-hydrolase [Dacryopinax primogenitus]|uniref:Alpha/beta-hydrolase n=1 Tax=Dacryopinax primogenitus (strain DJM 731) TaxID=1858805 RepID=M5FY36_DACPD|nr:alpha/beta-hydrolase [Dacryopinax primogenitus]EJT98476.1 alpha/beta-hydrolase [Dacryopinax primogenitus]